MCCILTILIFLGPRIAGIVWWIARPNIWVGVAFNSWIWPVLGLIFLPWTTLMWVIVAPGGLIWWEWLFVVLAVIIDIGSYGGGGYGNRDRFGR